MASETNGPTALPFQLLFESSPHPYLILRSDPDYTIVAVNDRYVDATGMPREAIVGRGLFDVFPDNPDDPCGSGAGDLRASLERVAHDRRPDTMGVQKYDIPRRDRGDDFQVNYWSPVNSPVFAADGQVAFIIHHVEDVTDFILGRERDSRETAQRIDRMEAEVMHRAGEVKEANRRLKTALESLEQREAELVRMNARLAELDRSRTEFFANVSHEFRTPLALMLGPMEDILAKPIGADLARSRASLATAYRNTLRLLKLVNTLLDFSRVEADRAKAFPEPTDLAEFTAALASNFRSLCERAGLQLIVDCPPLPRPVMVDRGMWEKIVLNLVSNAFKFTFDGKIVVCLRCTDIHAELIVSDSGTGIAAHELPHLFERFHRVEGARGRSYEGSGIGLALIHQLVQLNGGSILVESQEGRGSRFIVRLPLAVGPATRPGTEIAPVSSSVVRAYVEEAQLWLPDADEDLAAAAAVPTAATRGHVLVADDNADMRGYIRHLLDRAGYTVQTVANGEQALAACAASLPELVLADVMMPGTNGLALLKALRADIQAAVLPIILLSAEAGEDAQIAGLAAGADDYIMKPFHSRELVARVDGAIRLARARRQAEERLHQLAHHDALTGLPNRLLFTASLPQAVERAKRHQTKLALLFLDLDRFKVINDSLGHAAGDQLLRTIAERLKLCVREQDLVARPGGDEFMVLLEDIVQADDAAAVAKKIMHAIVEPLQLQGREVVTGISIGISIYPDTAANEADLVKASDMAMYRAKARGRHTYEFYTPQLTIDAQARLSMEDSLRLALARSELTLYYQPQVELEGGRMVGVEALLRWQHPQLGLLLPEQFIGVAEESELVKLIGTWVVREACTQASTWRAADLPSVKLAINISLREILHCDIVAIVGEALQEFGLEPSDLQLELALTERFLHSMGSTALLQDLRRLGVRIAIDDFGTGHSSLGHLKHLPVDIIKIDRAFIHHIPADLDNKAITSAAIELGHKLGLKVIAEGVENLDQLEFLRAQGCDVIQGHLLSAAIPADEVGTMLATGMTLWPGFLPRSREDVAIDG